MHHYLNAIRLSLLITIIVIGAGIKIAEHFTRIIPPCERIGCTELLPPGTTHGTMCGCSRNGSYRIIWLPGRQF